MLTLFFNYNNLYSHLLYQTLYILNLNIPTKTTKINSNLFVKKEVEVFIKRDDLIDKIISGNKCRKFIQKSILQNQSLGFVWVKFGKWWLEIKIGESEGRKDCESK